MRVNNFLSHLQFLKVYEIIVSKHGHLMQPRAFPDKVTPDIDFTDKTVVQRNIPIVKNAFAGADNLQMITNKF